MRYIKTNFDRNIVISFVILLLISGGIMAFNASKSDFCSVNDFEIEASSLKTGELINFSVNAPDSFHWRWDFGDGAISFRSKASHQYEKEGRYLVKLQLNENCNIKKWVTIERSEKVIDSLKIPKFGIITSGKVYVGDTIKLVDSTSHASSWEWRFENNSRVGSTEKAPEYSYMEPGEKLISLVVNNDPEYVAFKKLTVLPKKSSTKTFREFQMNRRSERPTVDPVSVFLESVPDSIPTVDKKNELVIPEMNEDIFVGCLEGIAKKKLSWKNFKSLFCEDRVPVILTKDGEKKSLLGLFNGVSRKGRVKVKDVKLGRDKEGCVDIIHLDYR